MPSSPSNKFTNSSNPKHHHHGSHVGHIALGDTAVPALSTMQTTPQQEQESRRRVRALSACRDEGIEINGVGRNGACAEMDNIPAAASTDQSIGSGSKNAEHFLNTTNSGYENHHEPSKITKKPNKNKSFLSFPFGFLKKKAGHSKPPKNYHEKYHTQIPLSLMMRLWYSYREFAYRNTWCTPLLILLTIVVPFELSFNKSSSNPLHMFNRLSYEFPKDPVSGTNTLDTVAPFYDYPVFPPSFTMYGKGLKDLCFVFTAMIFFMFFREFCMQVLLRPLAKFCGLKRRAKIGRFMEQTYSILYFSLSTPFGLYIMYHNPEQMWYYNTESFYVHYPHKAHDTLFKLFYLLQAGFWAQQSLVLMLQLEKPRRDFHELVFHHVVTIALIYLSYHFHFAMIGIAVFITMDVSDIFLALSKTLNYLDSSATVPVFFLFVSVWIYTRHYLNIKILWSVLTEFRTVGPYTYDIPIGQFKCWISQSITFALLLALQLVNAYWLFLILRIMTRYVLAGEQKDERSDDEDEEEEEEEEERKVQEKKQQ